MKFLLFAPDDFLVGFFTLSYETRTWTFEYSPTFKDSGYAPISDFPLSQQTYGHETCVKWLADRLYVRPGPEKGLTMATAIKNNFNNRNYPLQLQMVV